MNVVYLVTGLIMILLGAKYLVDGSTAIAKKLRMSEFLIGITIVGIGTSMPELVVSAVGAIRDQGDVAIGNVTGSNIANILLILGVTALIRPIAFDRSTLKFDIPYNIFSTILLLFFCFGLTFWRQPAHGVITRWEGVIFLALFAFFIFFSFKTAKREEPDPEEETGNKKKSVPMILAVAMIIGGLAALIFGGRIFVSGGTAIARTLGISEAIISITVLALGTSLPELATSAVAAFKGNTQLALGNIIGSNIFNVYLILGVSAVIRPLDTGGIIPMDIYMTILAAALLPVTALTINKNRLDKAEGVIFLIIYAAYVYSLTLR